MLLKCQKAWETQGQLHSNLVVLVRSVVHIVLLVCFMLFKEIVFAHIILIFLLIFVDNNCVCKEHNYHLLHFLT